MAGAKSACVLWTSWIDLQNASGRNPKRPPVRSAVSSHSEEEKDAYLVPSVRGTLIGDLTPLRLLFCSFSSFSACRVRSSVQKIAFVLGIGAIYLAIDYLEAMKTIRGRLGTAEEKKTAARLTPQTAFRTLEFQFRSVSN